jgi:hypothetical protein
MTRVETDVATARTRASRRLQKEATAAPLALSLDRERDLGMKRETDQIKNQDATEAECSST